MGLKSKLYKGNVFYADHIGEGKFSYWNGMDLYRTELCDNQIEKLISLLKTPDFSADIFPPVESFPDECKYINALAIGESLIKKEQHLNGVEEDADTIEYDEEPVAEDAAAVQNDGEESGDGEEEESEDEQEISEDDIEEEEGEDEGEEE